MLTENIIFAKIKELDERGVALTQKAIRDALGSGSFTTINNALKNYIAQKTAQETAPDAFVNVLVSNANELFTVAIELASERFAAHRAELNARLEARDAELEEAQKEIIELEAALQKETDALVNEKQKTEEICLECNALKKLVDDMQSSLHDMKISAEAERAKSSGLMEAIAALRPANAITES